VGAIDDQASELLKSNRIEDTVMGGLMKLAIAVKEVSDAQTCVGDFAKVQYDEPMQKWESEVDRIRAEPVDLENSCQRDAQHLAEVVPSIQAAESNAASQEARVKALDAKMLQFASSRLPITWCVAQ